MEPRETALENIRLKTDDEKALPPPPKLDLKFDPTAVKASISSGGITTTEELARKLKKTEERDPDSAIEAYGDPGSKKENREGKVQCKRCESWIYEDEMLSHMNSHSTQILEWLYLGGFRNSSNHKELTVRTNIGYILNVSVECQNSFPEQFVYKKYELEDHPSQDLTSYFEEACEFLEEARKNAKNALVHCIQGMSRSVSFVIAYLIMKQNMKLREAYEYVYSKRSIIKPNPGFMTQLIQLEKKVHGVNTITEEEIHSPLEKSTKPGSDV